MDDRLFKMQQEHGRLIDRAIVITNSQKDNEYINDSSLRELALLKSRIDTLDTLFKLALTEAETESQNQQRLSLESENANLLAIVRAKSQGPVEIVLILAILLFTIIAINVFGGSD